MSHTSRWSPTAARSPAGCSPPAVGSASAPSPSTPIPTPAPRTSPRPTRGSASRAATATWTPQQLIAAARAAGADAIHPGYGFLSENAEFAAAVLDAGLTWIGPPVAAVAAMGSKIEAKKMMAAAGVPVLDELDPETVTADQLPVLIKASAGGGGRGMRVVRELSELPAQVEAARREAQSAFGDPTVFCERYLATGHHVEVQVLADEHGTVWAVGERECSIQRRHQKIIEEAPSPLVERTPGMRDKLFDAARLAATAIGYTGAGTVEFMADERGDFFFLEMNTRLQVEHPVTEATTGLDLVELQLHVADGGRLDPRAPAVAGLLDRGPAVRRGPGQGLAAAGRHGAPLRRAQHRNAIRHLDGRGVRVDTGIVDGSEVSVFYDPMLAKVISYAPTRRQAAGVLADALARTRIHGVRTNRDLLVNVLRHPAFLDGATDTAFFDTHGLAELAAPLADRRAVELSALAAALGRCGRRTARPQRYSPPHPADGATSRRASRPSGSATAAGETHEVRYRFTRSGVELPDHDGRRPGVGDARPGGAGGRRRGPPVRRRPLRPTYDVFVDSPLGPVQLVALPRFPDPDAARRARLTARARCRARCCASARRWATPSPPASR